MKASTGHLLYMVFFLIGILALGLVGKSLLLLALYSIAIVVGAMVIAWAAESSEFLVSEGLALVMVAWLQVFPEFMIEATIAWAQDVSNMLANFTGANRILVGVGWPLVFIAATAFNRKKHGKFLSSIHLKKEHSAEVVFFLLATIYSIVIFMTEKLTIFDSVVMICIYLGYLFYVSKLPHLSRKHDKGNVGTIPKKIVSLKKSYVKPAILLMFLTGGLLIFFVADPFYESALFIASSIGISQFLFIQWVAPFLSEFPEKTSAFYWASKVKKAPMALMNLISSELTQLTLLLAMLPIVYSVSTGTLAFIPLSTAVAGTTFTIRTELLLTIATSLYSSTFLLKLRFTWLEAASLLALWLVQFIWVFTRPYIIVVYFLLILVELVYYRKEIGAAFHGFHEVYRSHVSFHSKN